MTLTNRFKITVGNGVAYAYADTEDRAKKLGEKLARQHQGETVVCLDTHNGNRAFTMVYGCRDCQ